ncbi:hypothetical protein BGX34_011956 [Mortierella sp. NVP85]|nr:hypothetical protein BGX34_011956 [Mortierella sp. NVP85]
MPTTLQTSDLLGCEQEGVLMQESLAVDLPTTVVVSCPIADREEQAQVNLQDNYESSIDNHPTASRSDKKTTAPEAATVSMIPRPKSTPKDTQRNNSKSSSRPSRLAIPVASSRRAGQTDQHSTRSQAQTTVNRLELENTFLLNHNNSLNRDIQHCRQTVQALKSILSQKEDVIEQMKHQYQQAHLKIKFMENIIAGHHHETERGPTSDDILEEDMFRLPEDEDEEDEEDEEEESLVFLQSLAGRGYFKGESTEDSIESEDEQDSADGEDEEELAEEDHPLDHGPNYDKERVLYSYPDDWEGERMAIESGSKDDLIDTHMDQSHDAPSINLYQQPNAPYHPTPMNNSKESANRVQVIRRRPHRQLGPAVNDPALQPMSAEFAYFDSSSEAECTTDTNDSDRVQEKPVKRVTLRDSGHFQSDMEGQDQHSATYRSLTAFPEDETDQEEPLTWPIEECEDTDSYSGPSAIVPSGDLSQHDVQRQSNSQLQVEPDPRTFSLVLLTHVQVETDSTRSSSSHDVHYDHQAGNRMGRSENLAQVASDDRNISRSGSKDTVQAEDWSSSSIATILSGTTETANSTDFEKDPSKGVLKVGSERSKKTEGAGSPLPFVLRFSSKVRRSRLLGKPKDKAMSKSPLQGHQEAIPVESKSSGAEATTTLPTMSDTETRVPLGPATLPITVVEPLDTEASVAATTAAQATPPDSARKSTIWSRVRSGLGLSKDTKGERVSNATTGPMEVPGQPAVRADKSTGIWKLRPRSRLRPKPTTAVPVSAMVDTNCT